MHPLPHRNGLKKFSGGIFRGSSRFPWRLNEPTRLTDTQALVFFAIIFFSFQRKVVVGFVGSFKHHGKYGKTFEKQQR